MSIQGLVCDGLPRWGGEGSDVIQICWCEPPCGTSFYSFCVQPFSCTAHGPVELGDRCVYPPRPSVSLLQVAESQSRRPTAFRSHCQVSGSQERVTKAVVLLILFPECTWGVLSISRWTQKISTAVYQLLQNFPGLTQAIKVCMLTILPGLVLGSRHTGMNQGMVPPSFMGETSNYSAVCLLGTLVNVWQHTET